MRNRWVKWLLIPGGIGGLCLLAVTLWFLRPAHVRAIAEKGLAEHLNLDAQIEELHVTLLPRPNVSGGGLTLRVPNHPELPPFIRVDRFTMDVGLFSMLRRHVETVHADGLHIAVPPGDIKNELNRGGGGGGMRDIIIDHFITHNAELLFVPKKADHPPLTFAINDLEIDSVGFNTAMPFHAKLINPKPRGLVNARGSIGPWNPEDITDLPVSGAFTFEEADLSTINGIGGWVNAKGDFKGVLTEIAANGSATVRDFSLDLGGHPASLTSTFETVVDGTDGTTVLKRVDAVLGQTHMLVSGEIANQPGPGRHDVELNLEISSGRIEDLLSLVLDTPKPVMVGDVSLKTTLRLPPGKTRVRNRISVAGQFGLQGARFSDATVQQKMHDLSRRSQGKDEGDAMQRVLSDLRGKLDLSQGIARLENLTFEVPGAQIALDGSYALESQALDFRGTLRMEATVSQAVGGFKSIFIKPFDSLFRRDGAGAIIPIKISGTRQEPKFGMEMGRVFKRK
ncbi:MAG: AsmA-like C-terminal region-containing protein [Acidobacteriota bacterium]